MVLADVTVTLHVVQELRNYHYVDFDVFFLSSEFRGQPNLSLPQALQLGTTGTIEGGR